MATGVIRCSVVSSSAGRRNLCDSQAQLNIVQTKSKSFSYLNSSSNSNNTNNTSSSSCACVRCHIAHTSYCKDTWPVEHKHQPLSAVSLGTLSAKESPLFARRQLAFQLDAQQPSDQLEPQQQQQQQLSCSHYPLRSATPAYASRKPQIDLSAVEALNIADMPAARINNMDINRNNGYLYNGVSTAQNLFCSFVGAFNCEGSPSRHCTMFFVAYILIGIKSPGAIFFKRSVTNLTL
ncbi:uncharacterized protein LOC135434926 [Drosophila montana]|uniref:uncharacterized protein LOC135434926 n=1 Tax=Drosophila montana TaxID=40370 RepID=UPI00313BF31A